MESRFEHENKSITRWFLAAGFLAVFIIAALVIHARGQKGVPPLTKDEQLTLRNEEVTMTNAENQLHTTKEWAAYEEAQQKLQEGIKQVYSSRSLDMKDYTICDGDAAAICAGVAKGTLELRPIPKQQAQK